MEMHLVHTNDNGEIAVLGFIFTTKQTRDKPKLKLSESRMHLVLYTNKMDCCGRINDAKEIGEKSEAIPVAPMGEKSKASVLTPMKGVMEEEQEESDELETDSEWESENEDKDLEFKDNDDEQGNDFLSQFWDQLPREKTNEDILLERDISFDYLFETSSNNFVKNVETNEIDIDMELFEYMGSLS